MGKFFIITVLACLILLAGIIFAVLFFYNPGKTEIKNEQNTNNVLPVSEASKTSVAYGVKMLDKCYAQFQDFIKNSGQDYSKCLVNFNFNNEYCGGFNPDTQALSDANVIVILDASGSMAEKIGPDTKIDIAKKAVSDFLNEMPQSVNTGLVVYGHEGSNSLADKAVSCKGIEEVVTLGKNNSSNIIAAMNSFEPKGWTPIAGSLDFAKNILLNKGKDDKDYLILVSDGVESCDGDPVSAATNLKAAIPNIQLSIIGFATDSATQESLRKIADLGGGSYLTAANSSGIAKAFNDQLLLIKKDCINVTLSELSVKYEANNLNNINCWLAAQKKESSDFSASQGQNPADAECNQEVSQALNARQKDFWNQGQNIEQQDAATYQKTETDLNNQLKSL